MINLIHKKTKSPNKTDPWRGTKKHILKSNTVLLCGIGVIFFLVISVLGHIFPQYISLDITGKSEMAVLTLSAVIVARLVKGGISLTK